MCKFIILWFKRPVLALSYRTKNFFIQ